MSLEEEVIELSQVVAGMKEHIEDLEQLIRDIDALMQGHFPYTWNKGEGLPLQERMKELGVLDEKKGIVS